MHEQVNLCLISLHGTATQQPYIIRCDNPAHVLATVISIYYQSWSCQWQVSSLQHIWICSELRLHPISSSHGEDMPYDRFSVVCTY